MRDDSRVEKSLHECGSGKAERAGSVGQLLPRHERLAPVKVRAGAQENGCERCKEG